MSAERQRQNRLQGRFATPKRKSSSPLQQQGALQRQSLSPLSSEGSPNSSSGTSSASPTLRYRKSDYVPFERQQGPVVLNDHPEMLRKWITISETDNGISEVYFDPTFLNQEKAADHLVSFLPPHTHIRWEEKEVVVGGERYPQPRLVHWIGPYEYRYSSVSLRPNTEWPESVMEIYAELSRVPRICEEMREGFNSVLLNYYRDEHDSVAWHSDNELSMGVKPFIASISLGDRRRFELKRKPPPGVDSRMHRDAEYLVHLDHGSLIIMNGALQDDWLHRVPKERHNRAPRINLTFRTVYQT